MPHTSVTDAAVDWRTDMDSPKRRTQMWRDPATTSKKVFDPHTLSPTEIANHRNKTLKAKHGDIPEVQAYHEFELRLIAKESMTLDEHVEYLELVNFFYPHPKNKKGLENWQRLRRKLGGNTFVETK